MKQNNGGHAPGNFSRDAVRDIVKSMFYAGWVTYAEYEPLNMHDDLEHPEHIPGKKHHTRHPQTSYRGLHEALIPTELWMQNQFIRVAKAKTPTTARKPTRTYLLSGVGFCWECYRLGLGGQVGLRGSTNGSGQHSYRCATLHDRVKVRRRQDPLPHLPAGKGLASGGGTAFAEIIAHHTRSCLPAGILEPQVMALISRMVIPSDWMDHILAYYCSDEGMGEFILGQRNLFLRMERAREQHSLGFLDTRSLEQERDEILSDLDKLKPAARPEAREILPLLADFRGLIARMTPLEQRAILKDIFAGLYFDGQGQLVKARPHAPFAPLLGLA